MPEIFGSEKHLTGDEINEFERALNQALPNSFKVFYCLCNGGHPAEDDVEKDHWGLPVHGFNPIKYGKLPIEKLLEDFYTISPPNSPFGHWERRSFIPFAYDAGGHPVFLSLRKEDWGCIYIHDPDGGDIAMVAQSFDEFLSKLYKFDLNGARET